MKRTIITGDIHGYWGHLNALINRKKPDKLIICGDFGFWPHFHQSKNFHRPGMPWDQYGVKNPDTDIYWIDGNHENHEVIAAMVEEHGRDKPILMEDFKNGNVYYMPRCSTMKVEGHNCLFIGGALSIDKDSRVEGVSWWRNEVLSYSDYRNLPDEAVDVVFSHTIPSCVTNKLPDMSQYLSAKFDDPSCKILEEVFYKYKPKQWFFGHFHKQYQFDFENCSFTGLDMAHGYGRWWTYL